MPLIRLSPRDRAYLMRVARDESNARKVQWAQVLLWLNESESVPAVAQRLHVSRQSIYYRLKKYRSRLREPIQKRISHRPHRKDHRPHPGRPPKKLRAVTKVLQPLLKSDPRRFGERSPVWTTARLFRHVNQKLHDRVSYYTVRLALLRLLHVNRLSRSTLEQRAGTFNRALQRP
jgi:hypothetical protein